MNATHKASKERAKTSRYLARALTALFVISLVAAPTILQSYFGYGISPDTVAMQRCSGTWTESTGACSGSITTIDSSTATSTIKTVPISLAASTGTARLRLLASTNVVSVSISVFIRLATDIPAGVTSYS